MVNNKRLENLDEKIEKAKNILEKKYKRKFVFNEIIDIYITFYPENKKSDYNYGVNINDGTIKLDVLGKNFLI